MSDTCFVIQPFDRDKFDKRFEDVYKPAIEKAHLTPYRVDKDWGVAIPINDIEVGIRQSTLCFADITLDNPNVWYELGYAYACGKDVVMVCSNDRTTKFPFDIQHKTIITYSTGSKSDFDVLEMSIINKIEALLRKQKTVNRILESPIRESHGLKPHEIGLLVILMENQLTDEDHCGVSNLCSDMERAGFTKLAVSVAIRELKEKDFIETFVATDDYNNYNYSACRIAPSGINWILENQGKLDLRKGAKAIQKQVANPSDDLPF